MNPRLMMKSPNSLSRWSTMAASLIFSLSEYVMLSLYATVHWKIMFNSTISDDKILLEHTYSVLDMLRWLRIIFAVLAIVYASILYESGSKLLAVIASFFAVLAIMTVFVVM